MSEIPLNKIEKRDLVIKLHNDTVTELDKTSTELHLHLMVLLKND